MNNLHHFFNEKTVEKRNFMRIFNKKSPCIFLLILCLLMSGNSVSAASEHTREAVRARYQETRPRFAEDPFSEYPVCSAPYQAGSLRQETLDDALNSVCFMRYLAYLPETLQLSDGLNQLSQTGAVLLAAGGQISHTPAQPADMSDEFYHQGLDSTSTSNLFAANWMENTLLVSATTAYMRDESLYNLPRLGHRRWLLNPAMLYTGFGLARSNQGTTFAVMQVSDQSAPEFEYEAIAWPSRGAFPADLMTLDTPWSLSFNPAHFDLSASQPRILLNEQTSGASFLFENPQSAAQFDAAPAQQYFVHSAERYGTGDCLIFRPDLSQYPALESGYQQNQIWQVEVSGLTDAAGQSCEPLRYTVSMMALEAQPVSAVELEPQSAELQVGQSLQMNAAIIPLWADDLSLNWSVSDPEIAQIDASGRLTGLKAGWVEVVCAGGDGQSDRAKVHILP